jgi:hypothetical protein
MDQDGERQRLRQERDRLHRQIADLIAHSVRVTANGDPSEREQHRDDLEQHLKEFRAYRGALARFHRLYGPLGE